MLKLFSQIEGHLSRSSIGVSILFIFYLGTFFEDKTDGGLSTFLYVSSAMFDNPGIKTTYSAIILQILR